MLLKVVAISALVLVLAYYFRANEVIRDGKVVNTGSGPVQSSILTSRDGRDYYAWHQIPYAKAPIGNLRFADPLPIDSWSEVIDGRKEGPKCAQANLVRFESGDVVGSEDCLHVNIFVPKQLHDDTVEAKKPKQPVIVFIHGGAFVCGSSQMAGPSYFMDEDVIYVTLQYRLDILGFFTTGDKVARGNQGLKDQTMALKWVKKNIEHFGGDPNQITILGISAGGASVHHQMLSPLSKGLFQKAMSQSGAASNTWGLITLERSLEKTKEAASTFNCPTDNSQLLVDCLRTVDMETLLQTRVYPLQEEYGLFSPHMYDEGFEPIIEAVKDEKTFLADHPLKIISEGKAHRVPFLIGHSTHEGLISSAALQRDPKNLQKIESELVPALKTIFAIKNPNVEEIVRKIKQFYIPDESNNLNFEARVKQYVDLLGDAFFSFDIRETVRLQRKFSPVYFYLQNNTDLPDMYELMVAVTWKRPFLIDVGWYFLKAFVNEKVFGVVPEYHGISHGADMVFFFPIREVGWEVKKGDKLYQYSKDLVNLFVQFAKDHSKMEFRGVQIPPVASEGPLKVAEFKPQGVIISPEPFTERMEFLRSLKIR